LNAILVSSPAPGAGKTTAIVALGQWLRRSGRTIDYRRLPGPGAEADAAFVTRALRLGVLATRVGSPDAVPGAGDSGADVLFVETSSYGMGLGLTPSRPNGHFAKNLVIARYQSEGMVELVRFGADGWPPNSTSVLLNAVPEKGLRQTQNRTIPALRGQGYSVMGVLPQDRVLLGMTVGDLAESLGAEVLCARDQLALPVEAVMIAAMSDEGAEAYFRRIAHKTVVAGGDRPDIHMPALATDTSCIVLTEGYDPDPTVFKTAEDQGVPLLKVTPSTVETLEHISTALASARFRQEHKISSAVTLFGTQIDANELNQALGLGREVAR
jgi:hypothetical protein